MIRCGPLEELKEKEVNALVVFLGNLGPEGPETMLAQEFDGTVDGLRGCRGKHRCAFERAAAMPSAGCSMPATMRRKVNCIYPKAGPRILRILFRNFC